MNVKARLLPVIIITLLISSCKEQSTLGKISVPDGYQVEVVAGSDLVDYPMFATLDETGRLFVFESVGNVYQSSEQAVADPQFRIKLLVDSDQDGKYDQATIFADKLSFPQGGVFVDGSLIASSAPDLLKLTDTDGDGVADEKEVLLSGWTLNVNANSLIGPFLGPDGWLYLTSAIEGFDINTREGARMVGETARIWRVKPDGSQLEWLSAGGMNNPVELTFTPSGEVIGTQTFFVDPQRGVRDAITYWTEGGVYGKQNSNIDRDSLPRTGDLLPVVNQYSRVAPVGIATYKSQVFGDSFKNDLFSTQFNTHQVLRHKLTREGGSFSLQDELFLWTENPDFHPTDVLEDADGSLLVVETGGWFILGCPLSQVSKPQLKGAIYRISKTGMPKVADPYGNEINWNSSTAEELTAYLEDPRPWLSERALGAIIALDQQAIPYLGAVLQSSTSVDARVKAVYGLYQINSKEAYATLGAGFEDEDVEVKVATARVAGLSKSMAFSDPLIRLLSDQHPAVVRQAATALGQIGEPRVINDLIQAAEITEDRFVDHAITFALIALNQPQPLLAAMPNATDKQKKAMLLALDQMTSSSLTVEQVLPLLDNRYLKTTALWVASKHPEWAVDLIAYLEFSLTADQLSEEDLSLYTSLIKNYCATPEVQQFIQKLVAKGGKQIKSLALNAMGDCQIDPFPDSWKTEIAQLLNSSNEVGVLMQTVDLVKLRGLTGLVEPLSRIISDSNNPLSLRVASISAVAAEHGSLSESQFRLLCDQFTNRSSPIVIQNAAYTLAAVELTVEQIRYLTEQVLPLTDSFILPRLLPALETAADIEVGTLLAGHLMTLPSLDNFTEPYLTELFSNYPDEIQKPLDDLLAKLRTVRKERIDRISTLEQSIGGGNEEKGRVLYFGKATCSTCHTMREGGGTLGPDLTSIQKDRSVHDIIEAVVYPSVSFVREYETYELKTTNGDIRGIIKEQTPDMILVETAPGAIIRVPAEDVINIEQSEVSMMPQGLDQLLTEEEFNDLMAYLLAKDLVY